MRLLPSVRRSQYILYMGVCIIAILVAPNATVYGSAAEATLRVNPILCVIDVTQDGTNQILHVPTESCIPLIPNITTIITSGQPNPSMPLPFAGADPIAIRHPQLTIPIGAAQQPIAAATNHAAWQPVASAQANGIGQSTSSGSQLLLNSVIGGTVSALAAAAAIHLFILEHSRVRAILRRLLRHFSVSLDK